MHFLFARGELTTQDNQWECSRTLASDLGFSSGTEFFQVLADGNPVVLRNKYQVVYIAPGVSSSDYAYLQRMVTQGGLIDQFVSLGGVAVINVAGLPADQGQVAPAGVTLATTTTHDSEDITAPDHPYLTGLGFGGNSLTTGDFDNWGPNQPTDLGTLDLTNLTATPTTVLGHGGDQPTWLEYRHGDGKVIVTTLSYCWAADPSVLTSAQRAATTNLLRYSTFFSGSAFTPAPTVTVTGSPTPTRTRTFAPTRTTTPTPIIPTPTATPVPTLADVIAAIFGDTTPVGADINSDGSVTAADVPALIQLPH